METEELTLNTDTENADDEQVQDELTKEDSEEQEQGEAPKEEDNAPENYDFSNVTMPDGMELDSELTEEFKTLAKEMNLSQGKADKFMTMGVNLATKLQTKFENLSKEAKENQIKNYKEMLHADSEIGGGKLKESLLEANEAYKTFVSKEASDLLAEAGLTSHPAIVKVFMNIGKQLKNDTIHQSGVKSKERSALDWYPSMKEVQD